MPDIGFIGLGTMGGPMAKHLVDAGYNLTVYDIDDDAVAKLTDAGASAVPSPAAVGSQSTVVFTSLPRPEHVEQVIEGDDGLQMGLEAGDVLVDLSTSTPGTTTRIADALADEDVSMLGAPVSGGRAGAEEGALSVMVGGDGAVLEACQPYLSTFAEEVIHVGEDPSHGHAVKLLQNYLNFTAMVATAEATVLGEKAGLEMETMLEVFNASSARSVATEVKFPEHVLPKTYDRGFTLALTEKDVSLLVKYAEEYNSPLLLGSTVRNLIGYARSDLGGETDQTRLYEYFKKTMD